MFSGAQNQDVCQALKQIKHRIDQDIVKLQHENQVYRATSELPSDLFHSIKSGTLLNEGKQKKKKVTT